MRALICIALIMTLSHFANAQGTLTLNQSGPEARVLIGTLADGGIKATKDSQNQISWQIDNLYCQTGYNQDLETSVAIPSYQCHNKSQNISKSLAYALFTQLEKMGMDADCGMGRCQMNVTRLRCQITSHANINAYDKAQCSIQFSL